MIALLIALEFLVGDWTGEGKHPYGAYEETQAATRILDVIQVRTKSTMNGRVVHEDLRIISTNPETKKLRMRQWAKGWLRVYEGEVLAEGEVVFTQTATEGGEGKWNYTFTPHEKGGFSYRVEVDGKAFVSGELMRDPGKGGGREVERLDVEIDGMRAQVHHPEGEGPFPLIVFSPGGDARTARGYEAYGRFWASWGFVTIVVAFDGPDAEKFGKVIDRALAEDFPVKIDGERVAVAGHSRGGAAAIRAARKDGRVKACLALAPSGPAEKVEGEGEAVACVIVGERDDLREAGKKAHANLPGEHHLIEIEGMGHMLGPRASTLELVRRATAFWQLALRGDGRYRAALE